MAEPIERYTELPRAVFTDVDGTLTTGDQLAPATYAALCALAGADIPVVVVTGRPSSWGEALARMWPVAAVVTENGGVTYARRGQALYRRYGVDELDLAGLRERLHEAFDQVRRSVPGARLAADSRFREVDLAIDWNEEASLTVEQAERVAALMRRHGFEATRSSVHVNVGPRGVDKLTACRGVIAHELGADPDALADYVYVGDALNDAPMFGGFPHAVGVANVREVWDELAHRPRYVTAAAEGAGFEELARVILARAGQPAAD